MEPMTIHRLRRSDSLEFISAKYRVPVCMIMRANALSDPQQLYCLRELKIPYRCHCNRCADEPGEQGGPDGPDGPGEPYEKYIVQPDDTLYGIARGFGLTMRILLKANAMEDPDDIKPGESLVIPRLTGEVYCVREGECLDEIAQRFGTTIRRVRQVNRLDPREDIYPGLLLLIPEM